MWKMGNAIRWIKQRNKALNVVSELMNNPDHVNVIHYSCESFYDRADGSSPRITSIAVQNLANDQTKSFSIHQIAEREKVNHDEIEANYDRLEKKMLDEFFIFAQTRVTHTWLHWNMRDINYGFAAIAHRYSVLGSCPIEFHESKLVDLSRLVKAIYGVNYIDHPHIEKLVEKNTITNRDFLIGADEAKAFIEKEYVKLHQSTLRKVRIFKNVLERIDNKSLKTNATLKDIYGCYLVAIGEIIKDSWIISIITFLSTIAGIIVLIVNILK